MNDYSNSINFFDWSDEWRLDQDDEAQVDADLKGTSAEVKYLKFMVEKLVGLKSSSTKIEES